MSPSLTIRLRPSIMTRINLYPHQIEAIENLSTGSVLVGGVGTGKSRTSLAYFYSKECGGEVINDFSLMTTPKDLYIITTARKRDTKEWEEELEPFLLSTNSDLNYCGIKVIIDSWNNIAKYVDVKNSFFIFDEQRVVGYGKWVKSFLKITKFNNWILLSATPGDTWMDYAPIFIANNFFKNRTEFIRKHVIYSRFTKYPKIEKYTGVERLEQLRQCVLVNMQFDRKTIRHHEYIYTTYDKTLHDRIVKDRWHIFEDRPLKDISEMCLVLRRLVNSDVSRIKDTVNLLSYHNKLIIFYNFNYELELLKSAFDGVTTIAEWNGHKHQPLPSGETWVYLVQYTAGAEGWNCIKTDTIVFFSQNYSYKIMEQAAGRIDRLNTPFLDLYYYHMVSDSLIDKAIRSTLEKKKSFNEASLNW